MLELAQEPLDARAVGGGGGGGGLAGSVRTGVVRADLPLTVLPLAGLSPLQSSLSQEAVPPPLSPRAAAHTAGCPAAPLAPLTLRAEP